MEVGLGPGHSVLDRDPGPPPLKGQSPQFSAHVCCGRTAGWIKMPLGREVGLETGDIVLDGEPASQKGAGALLFGPCIVDKRLHGSRCHLVRR